MGRKNEAVGTSGGLIAGVIAGAKVGAGVGIAAGPLGAIAGTIPGAIAGGLIGALAGNKVGSVDTTGFIHDANGKPTAQVLSSGHGVDTVIDPETGEITLNNNGFVTNQDGVVGNIKKS